MIKQFVLTARTTQENTGSPKPLQGRFHYHNYKKSSKYSSACMKHPLGRIEKAPSKCPKVTKIPQISQIGNARGQGKASVWKKIVRREFIIILNIVIMNSIIILIIFIIMKRLIMERWCWWIVRRAGEQQSLSQGSTRSANHHHSSSSSSS